MNIPLLDMIKQVPTYAKFLKDLCTVKKGLGIEKKAFLTEQVSAIIQSKTPVKYKDPGSPTISVNIGRTCIDKALLDLGASVNLLPYSIYKQCKPSAHKLHGELVKKSEAVDGELTASVTPAEPLIPPAQPSEKKHNTKELSMKATVEHITGGVKELLLLDPP